MINTIYVVHSDVDENNISENFNFAEEAIAYAKDNIASQTWVEAIELEYNDFGEVTDELNKEIIWSYKDELEESVSQEECFVKEDLLSLDAPEDPNAGKMATAKIQADLAGGEIICEGLDKHELNLLFKLCKQFGLETWQDVQEICDQMNEKNPLAALFKYADETGFDFELTAKEKEELAKKYPTFYGNKEIPKLNVSKMVEALNDVDDEVECVWCHEVYPKDDCKKEKNMGYLCDKCQRAIKSRGEDLEFEDMGAFDNLNKIDENLNESSSFDDDVKDSYDALISSGKVEHPTVEDIFIDMSNPNNYNGIYADWDLNPDPQVYKNAKAAIVGAINRLGIDLAESLNESKDVPIVDCPVNDVITHSEDEKPLDCKNEKKSLEKPLTESEDEEPLHYHCDSCGNDFDVFGGKAFRCMYCNSLHINQLDEAAIFNPYDPAIEERNTQADEWIDPLDIEFPEVDDDRYYDDDAEDFDRANVEAEKKTIEADSLKYYYIDYLDKNGFPAAFITSAVEEDDAVEQLCNYFIVLPEDLEINSIEEISKSEVEGYRADLAAGNISDSFLVIKENLQEGAGADAMLKLGFRFFDGTKQECEDFIANQLKSKADATITKEDSRGDDAYSVCYRIQDLLK